MYSSEFLAERFEADRRHLRSVASRLLSSTDDAEDAVQAAWMKISRTDTSEVRNLTGWFTTITVHECVDQLRARKRRGEVAIGGVETEIALSAVVPSPEDDVLLADAVSNALLVVLDRLSPAQRIAFVLHDVFAMPFEEIGELLDRSAAAAKKLASRARGLLYGPPPNDPHRTTQHLEVVDAFLAAARGGDIPALLDVLAPGVVRTVDRSLVSTRIEPTVRGADEVAAETKLFSAQARNCVVVMVDGQPGLAIAPYGQLRVVLRFAIGDDRRIHALRIIGDPDLLGAVSLTLPR